MALRIDSFEVDVTVRRGPTTVKRGQPLKRLSSRPSIGPTAAGRKVPTTGNGYSRVPGSGSSVASAEMPSADRILARATPSTPITPATPSPTQIVTDGMPRFISPPIQTPAPKLPHTAVAPGPVNPATAGGFEPMFKRLSPFARDMDMPTDEHAAARVAATGSGRRLDEGIRREMEGVFGGADFRDVRIHSDAEAGALSAKLGAHAFTTGRDVYFGKGKFDPASVKGKALLGHELTHVLQQSGLAPRAAQKFTPGTSVHALERQADAIAQTLWSGPSRIVGKAITVEQYVCKYRTNRPPTDDEQRRLETIAATALTVAEEIVSAKRPAMLTAAEPLTNITVNLDISLARSSDIEAAQSWGRRMAAAILSAASATAETGSAAQRPLTSTGPMRDADDTNASPLSASMTKIDVTESAFEINSATLRDVAAELNGRDEWGKTSWTVTYSYEATDGVVTSVAVKATIRIELPRWTAFRRQALQVQRAWNRMMTALRGHEDTHVRIARERINRLAAELVGKPETDLAALYNGMLQDLQRLSDDYDARTAHGETEGVILDADIARVQRRSIGAAEGSDVAEMQALAVEAAVAGGGMVDVGKPIATSSLVQRQSAAAPPAPPPTTPTPAPAPGAARPSPPPPPTGASKAETDPVELPLVARTLPIIFSSTRRDLKLTKEDFSQFEILKGEITTGDIPLLDTGVNAKFTAKADEGIRLANASLFITPISGEITGAQIAAAQSTKQKWGTPAAAVGGLIGGVLGLPLGPAGALKGAELGGLAGGAVGETLAELFGGAREFMARLTQGAGGVNVTLVYNPELTMALSATGFSWLASLETTLVTSLTLATEAFFDLKDSYVKLTFSSGRLLPSEFEIKPVIKPALEVKFDASGQLLARLVLLPLLRNEKPKAGEDEAIEAAEIVSVPFHLFSSSAKFEGLPLLTAVKASPLEIRRKRVNADEGKVAAAFESGLKSSKLKPEPEKSEKPKVPEDTGGPHTGLSRDDAIPLTWWKPFDAYVKQLRLPASEFGTERTARRFPNKHYRNERRALDLSLGVSNWPYKGMTLKKKQNERDKRKVDHFKEDLELHGVFLDRQAPGTQMDHVIDLVFDAGYDEDFNFWPLDAAVNVRAGSKWTNGTYLVTWAQQKGGPALRTTPADVPVGRWFVIVDEQRA